MVALDDNYKSRCRWHLFGTGAGVPAGDRAKLEEAMNKVPDDVTLTYIRQLIDRCNSAWADLAFVQTTITIQAETYAGDINRTVLRGQKNSELVRFYYDIYYRHVDSLARALWVPDYTTPSSDYYRYARYGGEYVNSIPGSQGAPGDVQYGFAYA